MKSDKKSKLKIYFMRHAEAESIIKKGSSDALRPLTEEGKLKHHLACQGLSHLNCAWDIILSSPTLRTQQTAKIVEDLFELTDCSEELKELAPGTDFPIFCKKINQYLKFSSLLVIGHEPQLSEWTSLLIGDSSNSKINFKKSAVACLSFDGKIDAGLGKLEFLMQPSQLQRLGKKRK